MSNHTNRANKYPSNTNRSLKDHRPVRWLVKMSPFYEENDSGYVNEVGYHNSLDLGGMDSLQMAISAASRYNGKIYADYNDGKEPVLVKSYY